MASLSSFFFYLLLLPTLIVALPPLATTPGVVGGVQRPLSTSGRWIVNEANSRVKLRCVNWAGHMETMIPEGLHRQSAHQIAKFIAEQGFNCVRLTYSIDMALAPDTLIADSFPAAAKAASVPAAELASMYTAVTQMNPRLAPHGKTVLDAFSLVIHALAIVGVAVILDNHVSHATWCCSHDDGNGWFGSAGISGPNTHFFDVDNWVAGLTAMANYASKHRHVVGLSIRNEFRPRGRDRRNAEKQWNKMAQKAGLAIHAANPNALILMGGIDYATELGWLYNNPLDLSQFGNKVVMEYHSYPFGWNGDCAGMKDMIGRQAGYLLAEGHPYTAPLFISEFGIIQDGSASQHDLAWLQCLSEYLVGNDADWAVWAVQGSYYVRQGLTDFDETWGLLKKDWITPRNSGFPGLLGNMWKVNQGPGSGN